MTQIAVQQLISREISESYAAGHWKDFQGRRLLCSDLGCSFSVSTFDTQNYQSVISALGDATTDVVIEYTFHPGLIQAIRRARPDLRVHVRAINAEALHHWHRANPAFWPTRRNCYILYGSARLVIQDRQCALLADSVLGISEWDQKNYWRRIAPGARLLQLPYFSPWPEIRAHVKPAPWDLRTNQIVCMPGGLDRISQQQRVNFFSLAQSLQDTFGADAPSFGITDCANESFAAPATVTVLGKVAEPWDLLCQSRALAVLTDLGFGTKTTIPDALAAGCHVFVHRNLMARLPAAIREQCISIDLRDMKRSTKVVMDAMDAMPLRPIDLNSEIRSHALSTFKSLLMESSANEKRR